MTESDKLKSIQEILNEPTDKVEPKPEVLDKVHWDRFPNFKPEEFRCNLQEKGTCKWGNGNCKYATGDYYENHISENLLYALQAVRNKYGVVTITCGGRCRAYNDSLSNSVKNSKHIIDEGDGVLRAADYTTPNSGTQSVRNDIVAFNRKLPCVTYSYCNVNGNNPGMGRAIHTDTK